MDRPAAPTGYRQTPRARRTPGNIFPSDPNVDVQNPTQGDNVKGGGDCLYHAFAVLLGTYGVPNDAGELVPVHLTARGVRNRLSEHVLQPQNWVRYFLRIAQAVEEARTRTFAEGPPPAPDEAQALQRVRDWLRQLQIEPQRRFNVSAFTDDADAQAALDPTEEEQAAFEAFAPGVLWPGSNIMVDMQRVVDSYVRISAGRGGNYAQSLEVELLSETFGVPIFFYDGGQQGTFETSTLRHIMYPTQQARDDAVAPVKKMEEGPEVERIRAARRWTRAYGFHIVRFNNHYWYGKRDREKEHVTPWSPFSEAAIKEAREAREAATAERKKRARDPFEPPAASGAPPLSGRAAGSSSNSAWGRPIPGGYDPPDLAAAAREAGLKMDMEYAVLSAAQAAAAATPIGGGDDDSPHCSDGCQPSSCEPMGLADYDADLARALELSLRDQANGARIARGL